MPQILKPPTALPPTFAAPSLFLAGSIAMGAAPPWQQAIETALTACDVVILNPRRDGWDSTWAQDLSNPAFTDQVNWELDALTRADRILMYFAPDTHAPITLLELGLFARSGKLVVCCPTGYWRKGNVDVVCARFGISQVATLDDLCADALAWCGNSA